MKESDFFFCSETFKLALRPTKTPAGWTPAAVFQTSRRITNWTCTCIQYCGQKYVETYLFSPCMPPRHLYRQFYANFEFLLGTIYWRLMKATACFETSYPRRVEPSGLPTVQQRGLLARCLQLCIMLLQLVTLPTGGKGLLGSNPDEILTKMSDKFIIVFLSQSSEIQG